MSQTIWTRCGGSANRGPYAGEAWRVVEAQHRISTRRLVDSDEEQALLEELIDRAKPPVADDCAGLHYLLATPFRYPPLLGGSRFGTRHERSLWYGSERLPTALAEVAFHRLLFLEGTAARIEPLAVDLSAFRVPIRSDAAVDLNAEAFGPWRGALTHPGHYRASQPFGTAMRADGVELVRYPSTRDPERGQNVALFSPAAFANSRPTTPETWHSFTTRAGVEMTRDDYFERRSLSFARELFEIDGALPAPGLA